MPPSKLPDLVYQTKDLLEKHSVLYMIIGHIGDGMSLKLCAAPWIADVHVEVRACRRTARRAWRWPTSEKIPVPL